MNLWQVAGYLRLSREDGDKGESESIANQRAFLEQFIATQPDLVLSDYYQDDGFTGTNFSRPAFQRMMEDIKAGRVNCVLVKDLSRFGRDYIEIGRYLEQEFPVWGVRFIAVNDRVDSKEGRYDMLLPMKNVLNAQYARDISDKVRTAIQTKQKRGEFVGAFASYGYRKDTANHNHLVIDESAAPVIRRIFDLFEQGLGKVKIAKQLNAEGVPSPSEYKRLMGERYHNGRKMDATTYWTYTTIHRILQNQMYVGTMEQGRNQRLTMHGKAKQREREDWTVVPNTHEAIITPEQWGRVQGLLKKRTRELSFEQNQSPFAGFLRCGDCGRAMAKTRSAGGVYYSCGSYKRYGSTICTKHSISHAVLEQILLDDINQIIAAVKNLKELAKQAEVPSAQRNLRHEQKRLGLNLERVYRLKKSAYEDLKEELITREDYLRYKEDYERQEQQITAQMEHLSQPQEEELLEQAWVSSLLEHGKLTELDRITVAETIQEILIFEDGRIDITYTFSNELGILQA